MEVSYTPSFLRVFKTLPQALQEEAIEKIDLFQDPKNHPGLKVHKLKGKLSGRYSFSVNYQTRIVFCYLNVKPKEALCLAIGDHDVYDD